MVYYGLIIGIMENNMETTIILGLPHLKSVAAHIAAVRCTAVEKQRHGRLWAPGWKSSRFRV